MPGEGSSPRFEILGRPTAWRDGRELDLGPGKQRAVLAVLLLTPRRPVPTASIVAAVWGDDPPDNGANVVQKYVAGLRRVLEPDRSPRTPGRLLTLTAGGYALHVPPEGLDTEVFQARVKAAQAVEDAAQAEEMLREALAMWRGPALAGLNGAFFDAARNRLEEMRAAALEARAEAGLAAGEHARLVSELLRLVAEFPLREGFRYLLMLALYRSGRQAEALAAYRDARDFLADEFGVEPGERLRALHLGILRSDPTLTPPRKNTPTTTSTPITTPQHTPPKPPLDTTPPNPLPSTTDLPHTVAASGPPHGVQPTDLPHTVAASGPPDGVRPTELVHGVAAGGLPYGGAASGHGPGAAAQEAFRGGVSAELSYGAPTVHDVLPSGAGPRSGVVGPPSVVSGRRVSWLLRAVLVSLPPLSFGLVAWALVAYFAARRRSRGLAGMAVGYLALSIVFLVGATSGDPERSSPWDGPLFFALLATMFGGAVHLALLTAESPGGVPVVNVQLIERRARRDQARSLAAHHPVIAHRLGIGRPDLATGFDDGGLVDVNSAPEHVLATLPGLDAHHAKLIVLARTAHGPLASVDDLVARQILPYQVVHAVREMMIAVPPLRDTELVL
ncbi:BTAD domain-containing putative transcriptional regulator [Actinomadura bangladeshensis]|uniref:BTAD domain-containing putative transcriptional regulator n=1 Tax=Actinomadura bangladeshensis TaxID=453573 RepID=UPI001A9E16E9|nr:BTAD domain-containing putative transcriptional regulator [Actinomadura bangladeshensis]